MLPVMLAYVRSFHEWHAEDRSFTITSSYVTSLILSAAPGSGDWELEKHLTMPPDAVVARRLETLTIGVLGQLEATANWHQMMGELLYGDEPSTELGRQEAAFFRAAGVRPSAA